MDKSKFETEMGSVLDSLGNLDATSKEYAQALSNLGKLHQMLIDESDMDLKIKRNSSDEDIRKMQIELEKEKLNLEKEKTKNQHEEKMAEIEVNRIKAENENLSIKQGQVDRKKEHKEKQITNVLLFAGKLIIGGALIATQVCMHKDELNYERGDNGIIPKSCKTYDAVVTRASEGLLR